MIQKNEALKRIKLNLKNPSKINFIYSIADVHIRNYKRHTEYQYVFNRLYDTIRQHKGDDFIIVVAGDISHAKTDMSPELVYMISNFLKSLVEIAPTFVIAGNHDCNLNNMDRLDVLNPIIELINDENLYYLKDTGIYSLEEQDIDFLVYSVFDDPANYFSPKESTASKKICLYHGVVDGCILDNGMPLSTNHVNLNLFTGADMGILGDIHKYQMLQKFEVEELEINESELEDYLTKGWQIK